MFPSAQFMKDPNPPCPVCGKATWVPKNGAPYCECHGALYEDPEPNWKEGLGVAFIIVSALILLGLVGGAQ